MVPWLLKQSRNLMEYNQKGLAMAFGMEPQYLNKSGQTVMSHFGTAYTFDGKIPPSRTGTHVSTLGDNLGTLGSIGMTAMGIGAGLMDGGIGGAMSAIAMEASANAATLSYAYHASKANDQGIRKLVPGRGVMGAGGMITRSITGRVVGSVVHGMIGGGFLGQIGFAAGAAVGTAHAGKILGASAVVGVGYLAAQGTSSILKAGYRHQQDKRAIHTSGSMAAFETQYALTMRERAVQAIHKSHTNSRQALGQEALYMSLNRDYFSRYR